MREPGLLEPQPREALIKYQFSPVFLRVLRGSRSSSAAKSELPWPKDFSQPAVLIKLPPKPLPLVFQCRDFAPQRRHFLFQLRESSCVAHMPIPRRILDQRVHQSLP